MALDNEVKEAEELLTHQEVYDYIPLDEPSEEMKRRVTRLIKAADEYLQGSIHPNYPKDSMRVKEVALMLIDDLYQKRTNDTKSLSNNVQRFIDSSILQIQQEMKRNG